MKKTRFCCNKVKLHILFGIFFLFSASVFPQKTERENLSPFLNDLKEEVVIHTDRTLYISGDLIWFRADYLINGQKPQKPISSVLYAELFNTKGEPVLRKKFEIADNKAEGAMMIPDGAATGNYVLRVYTQYQRNLSHYQYAYTHLSVFNPDRSPETVKESQKDSLSIIPEGGTVLNNKDTRYAIEISNPSETDSIVIKDIIGNPVSTLNISGNHLATMSLTQNDSIKYQLTLYLKNGDSITKAFAAPESQGVSLHAAVKNNKIEYDVADNDQSGSYTLEIYSSDLLMQHQKTITDGTRQGSFPINDMEEGLHFIILRDTQSSKILKLRTLYLFNSSPESPEIMLSQSAFNPREEVTVQIKPVAPNLKNAADLSVTVVRHGVISNSDVLPEFIAANPWLIKAFLSQQSRPIQYKEQIEAALIMQDHRILEELREQLPDDGPHLEFLPELRDVTVSGVVRDKDTKEPIPHLQVYGSVLFNNPQFHIYETDANGEFIFTLNDLHGMQDVFLSPVQRTEKAVNYEIMINQDFDHRYPAFNNTPFPYNEDYKSFLEELNTNAQLNLAFHSQANEESTLNDRRRHHLFGKERISRNLDDYVELDEMWDVLYEVIPHVRPVKKQNEYQIKIMDDNSNTLPGSPLVLLDNIPIFDVKKIMDLHPSQVDKIEVIDRTYLLGSYAINGVMLITTKTQNFGGTEFPEAAVFSEYQTLTPSPQFNEMTYDKEIDEKTRRIPDFRNLLYWNPQLKIEGDDVAFHFFTSDRKGKYDIIIRGITPDGKRIHSKKTFVVD